MDPKDLPGGGPAFPCDPFIASKPSHESVAKRLAEGMTLRDHFAGLAMQGFLSGHVAHHGHEQHWDYGGLASEAYDVADAMLKTRAA